MAGEILKVQDLEIQVGLDTRIAREFWVREEGADNSIKVSVPMNKMKGRGRGPIVIDREIDPQLLSRVEAAIDEIFPLPPRTQGAVRKQKVLDLATT